MSIDSENVFTDLTKNFDKQMQDWNSAIIDYTSPIKTMIEDVRKYLLEKPVVTEIEGGIKYTTTIKDNGALYNVLPNKSQMQMMKIGYCTINNLMTSKREGKKQ